MRTGWLKTPQPYFHIPCGGWFKLKGQKHECAVVNHYVEREPVGEGHKPQKAWSIDNALILTNMKGKPKKPKGC